MQASSSTPPTSRPVLATDAVAATGLVDGVTTNPTLIAKSGRPMLEVIAEICGARRGPGQRRGRRDASQEGMPAEGPKLANMNLL